MCGKKPRAFRRARYQVVRTPVCAVELGADHTRARTRLAREHAGYLAALRSDLVAARETERPLGIRAGVVVARRSLSDSL